MYTIIDSRYQTIVAEVYDFKEAKLTASRYRRAEKLNGEQWKLIQIKKKPEPPIKTSFIDDGCCDALRDRRMELFGKPSL